mmetsp:Transcript_13133/g.24079  ORF Transcript_13133/g.24079 Transcript_13133/m.24079 type:complete len:234 (+) Transcript_13133:920-1621(+)
MGIYRLSVGEELDVCPLRFSQSAPKVNRQARGGDYNFLLLLLPPPDPPRITVLVFFFLLLYEIFITVGSERCGDLAKRDKPGQTVLLPRLQQIKRKGRGRVQGVGDVISVNELEEAAGDVEAEVRKDQLAHRLLVRSVLLVNHVPQLRAPLAEDHLVRVEPPARHQHDAVGCGSLRHQARPSAEHGRPRSPGSVVVKSVVTVIAFPLHVAVFLTVLLLHELLGQSAGSQQLAP